jgi:glyceraldehyde-3-phosphate dehydrogenase (NADP+)
MTPLMEDGRIDFLAFIGRSTSANALVKDHPAAHRLHTMLQMDAKDCAIVLRDADVEFAATQCASGAFSFNGQRCTAFKLIWVHESIAEQFVKKVVDKVDRMKVGMPWEDEVKITPLCESGKPEALKEMLEDALSKGAHILNFQGGRFSKSLVTPTVVGPITKEMKLWQEEQFGPIMPITSFSSLDEPLDWLADNHFGLQSAVFGYNSKELARVIDTMAFQVGRVNVNAADKRGPDILPFGGKKDSGIGVTNAKEAVKGFTIETILATNASDENIEAVQGIEGVSEVFRGTHTMSK